MSQNAYFPCLQETRMRKSRKRRTENRCMIRLKEDSIVGEKIHCSFQIMLKKV